MGGFVGGTLALVILEVLLRPRSVDAATAATGVTTRALRRFLSPAVAGVPDRRKVAKQTGTIAKPPAKQTGTLPRNPISNPAPNPPGRSDQAI